MLRPSASPKRRPPHTWHKILKNGSASLRKPEAHKRLRLNKVHRRVLAWVRGTNIDPQVVAGAIELSTTRYCPVIGLLGKVAEVATCDVIEAALSSSSRRARLCWKRPGCGPTTRRT